MTELERHLLNALEQLQQDYMQRLSEWESAFVELQKMFSLTQRDNAMLNEQVQHLSERTERLSQLYSENRR
ncbi:mobilization protein [Escherichia coli]|uniref:MbeD family mobilization/exclusion protein n=1 Tax=Escherichia coli TaxID=562 RepID=UPI0013B01DF6|nr:MbeD family mobilization/exclusion protein [Escherichia coli]EGE2208875.1 mobilization protein [Escherichia coli]EKC0292621.1 MbeD family mobilization/exclusion protein [Escherichia coli]EKC9890399.1 MbeD family mobilization/exclusion protein [Escherichia coli]EKH7538732.1 MbeD family mobilization/exclusion protein [Escherichia coli]HEA7219793.1 MbeD family mobilization/exclusion protein [Escherichia coli]